MAIVLIFTLVTLLVMVVLVLWQWGTGKYIID